MGGMEEDKPAAAAVSTNSRWNPTEEQIGVLESLYKKGIRTPTADQIQEIAGRLREHGCIEGKNVFYWFQNHKARQRQKQKQETGASFNRLLRKASKVAPSPSPSPVHLPPHRRRHHHRPLAHPPPPPPPIRCTANAVLCSTYFFPHPPPGIGYYLHYPPVLLQRTVLPNLSNDADQFQRSYFSPHCSYKPNYQTVCNTHETLQLFPLHPTGPSPLEVTIPPTSVHSTTTTTACSYSKEEEDEEESRNKDDGYDDGNHLVLNMDCR